MAFPESRVFLDRKEIEVHLASLVLSVFKEKEENKESKASRDWRDLVAHPDFEARSAWLVHLEEMELPVFKDPKETPDNRARRHPTISPAFS